MKKLVIFCTGKVSDAISSYFELSTEYQLVSYVCDEEFLTCKSFKDVNPKIEILEQ